MLNLENLGMVASVRAALLYATSDGTVLAYQDFVYGYPYTYSLYLSMLEEAYTMMSRGLYNSDILEFSNGLSLLYYV